MRIRSFLALLLLLCGLSLPLAELSPLKAQDFLNPKKSAEPESTESNESPRFMMRRFMEILNSGDIDAAFPYVEFPKGSGLASRRILIEELIEVLNKRGVIDLAFVSNSPSGNLSDDIRPDFERIGTVITKPENIPILLRYSADKSRKAWRFAAEFMEKVPVIADSLHETSFENKLPDSLIENKIFGIKLWQWLGLLAAIAVSFIAAMVLGWILYFVLKGIVKRMKIVVPEEVLTNFLTPLRLFTGLFVFSFSIFFLDAGLGFRQKLAYIESISLTIFFCVFAIRITGALIELSRLNYERQGKHTSTAMLGPINKGINILIVVLGSISMMRSLGFDVTAIIAGLGIGGVAIALAGQKTIENLFGGISIIMDQPVRVGDFGRFGTTMGTVEDIGLRSTKVRTLDRTLVSIPNAEFSHMILENFEKRDKFRWVTTLGIRMDASTDQMRLLLMQIKELMLSHPMVYKDPARVRFVSFGDSCLKIEIFAYIKAGDFNEYIAVVEDMNLRIMDIIREAGTDLAYPAQTLFIERAGSISKEKINNAEKKIAAVKEATGFPQPYYPSSWSEDKFDTLDFPDGPER